MDFFILIQFDPKSLEQKIEMAWKFKIFGKLKPENLNILWDFELPYKNVKNP